MADSSAPGLVVNTVILQRPGRSLQMIYTEQPRGQDRLLTRCLPQASSPLTRTSFLNCGLQTPAMQTTNDVLASGCRHPLYKHKAPQAYQSWRASAAAWR